MKKMYQELFERECLSTRMISKCHCHEMNRGILYILITFFMKKNIESTKFAHSRHYSLNGIRNIIRMCSRFGVCSINMPLLLIERANEVFGNVYFETLFYRDILIANFIFFSQSSRNPVKKR